MRPRLTSQQVMEGLNLHDYGQGWGLCNANAERLPEFLTYSRWILETHRVDRVEYQMGDLLLQSASDVFRRDGLTPTVRATLELVAGQQATKEGRQLLAYWLKRPGIGEVMRQVLDEAQKKPEQPPRPSCF